MKEPYFIYSLKKKIIETFFIIFEIYYEDNDSGKGSPITTSYFFSKENMLETAVAYMELINQQIKLPTRERELYRVPVGFSYYIKGEQVGGYGLIPRRKYY